MSHWPLLSLVTFLPLVGAAFILMARGEEAVVARNARFIALWTSLIVLALSVVLWIEFDPSTAQFQFVERAKWISLGGFTITYHMGIDGISLFFILLSTLLTFLSIVSSWEVIQFRVKGIHDRVSSYGNVDGRNFLRARLYSVLRVLRGCAGPDVFYHRDLGRRKPYLFRVQVFSVYVPGFGIDAAGGHRGLSADRVDRYRICAEPHQFVLPRSAEMAVAGVLRVVCGQGADVAGAYLAPRCPCRGAYCGLGAPRRHPVEDGRLWLLAVFAAAVSARFVLFHAADLHPERNRGDLYLAGRASPDRYEKAGRLFVDRPYGLCDDGDLCRDPGGGAGRGHSDAEPWADLRRSFPVRRRALRPAAHPRDRTLWWFGRAHARLRLCLHGFHPGSRSACLAPAGLSASS